MVTDAPWSKFARSESLNAPLLGPSVSRLRLHGDVRSRNSCRFQDHSRIECPFLEIWLALEEGSFFGIKVPQRDILNILAREQRPQLATDPLLVLN